MKHTRILLAMPETSALQQPVGDLRTVNDLEILTAASLDETLALHRQHQPQVIVADYTLPPTNGLAILEALQAAGWHIPVIVATAQGSEQLAVECLRAGAADYLRLPVNAAELQEAIHRALVKSSSTPQAALPSALVDGLLEPILVVDDQGRLMYANEAARRLFNITEDVLSGNRRLTDITDNQQVLDLLTGRTHAETDVRREISLDDGRRTLSAQLVPIATIGRALVMHDFSSLKELDRIKSDFVRRVSHDIRSPLTTILGYVELLGKAGSITEPQQRFIDRITFSVQSIKVMLSALMELSQIEAGYDLELQPTQLPMIVRYAVDGSRQAFEDKMITLRVSLPEQAPTVLGSPTHLRQMIGNLLDNARKFTPEGGTVMVSLAVEGDFLVLRVSDSGIGIPAEDQPHIFEQFYRAKNVQTAYEGAGLGLPIVKIIVVRHNGSIWLESQSGTGTSFTIMLPAQPAPALRKNDS